MPKGLGFLRDSRPSGCRKTQGEHERAWGHANSNRGRRRVRRHTGAGFAAGTRRISAKSGEDDRGGGTFFPVRQLVKKSFGASWAFSPPDKIFRKCGFCDAAGDSRLSRALRKPPKRRGTEPLRRRLRQRAFYGIKKEEKLRKSDIMIITTSQKSDEELFHGRTTDRDAL